jgi:hypothetical protein
VRVGEYTSSKKGDTDHCIRANELTFVLVIPLNANGRTVSSVTGGSTLMAMVEFANVEYCLVGATSHKGGSLLKKKSIGKTTVEEDKSLFRLWQRIKCSGVRPPGIVVTLREKEGCRSRGRYCVDQLWLQP